MSHLRKNSGRILLIRRFSKKFETEENINYYQFKDYVKAKRKYLKYMLEGVGSAPPPFKTPPS